jgi:ABC-2 type transport system ATP-binding protein
MQDEPPILAVRGLRKVYGRKLLRRGGTAALDGVDLKVGRGSVFGLLGPNGAGKTTLVKILLDLARGYEGQALLFGRPPADASSRRRVGYLPEAHRLPGYLTGRQVMRLFGMLAGRPRRQVERAIPPLLEQVGMLSAADQKVRTYSKGMQQRLGLAQALIHEPELIFLDEPTDGVDPVGRAAIREMVLELQRRGVTVFINSHLLMEVELICDRVVIMHKGKILREGTIGDLTPDTGIVRVELGAPAPDLGALLAGIGASLKADGSRAFTFIATPPQVDLAIDRLRSQAISIRSVTPRKLTLEESFIDLVKEDRR